MKYVSMLILMASVARADCVTEHEYDTSTGQTKTVRRCGDHIKNEPLIIPEYDPCEYMTAFSRQYAFPGTCKKRLEEYKK